MKIAVTGASGFIGKALVEKLAGNGHQVLSYIRQPRYLAGSQRVRLVVAPELGIQSDWGFRAEDGIDVLVHAAARVHVMHEFSTDPLSEFRRVNTFGTESLARQAALAKVRRFVFLSSIKVNGEFTEEGKPFTADDVPAPGDPYGISKHEAEQLLNLISAETGMEVVIIRSPLVYGPGVKANFQSMINFLAHGVPLPLAAVTNNRRSFVALENLLDLIMICLHHPAARNQTFLVSDGEDLSTAQLLKRMGHAMGHPASLFWLPPALLKLGATILNKPEIYQRVYGSLQLDITKTRQLLGWAPPVSVDEGLRHATESFRP